MAILRFWLRLFNGKAVPLFLCRAEKGGG